MKISDYSAIAPWSGLQNKPVAISGVETANPPQTTLKIPLAALTTDGTPGSITIQNGVVISILNPT
jgi:hypothetical protein